MLNGTVPYYVERFKTSIMNRLVENEAITLSEEYNICKQEIELLELPTDKKTSYLQNLDDAFDHIQLYINGSEEMYILQ